MPAPVMHMTYRSGRGGPKFRCGQHAVDLAGKRIVELVPSPTYTFVRNITGLVNPFTYWFSCLQNLDLGKVFFHHDNESGGLLAGCDIRQDVINMLCTRSSE